MKSTKQLGVLFLSQILMYSTVYAQSQDLNAEIDAEIEQMYQAPKASQSAATADVPTQKTTTTFTRQVETPVVQSSTQAAPVAAPAAVVATPVVQKQPETVVESSPLTASRADSIRKGRQEEELRTETKIVEKLEQSRLEDEKRRADVLFGDRFDSLQNKQSAQKAQPVVEQAPVVAQPVQAAPVVSVQPVSATQTIQAQPIVINQNESLTRDAVREEVRAALTEDKKAVEPEVQQRYFSAIAGIGQYPDIDAIKGNYSLGAAFGTRFDYFLVEGAFIYSNYSVDATYFDNYNYVQTGNFDMNQYQGTISAKYQLLGGLVRPVVGGLLSYSYRTYSLNSTYNTYNNGYYPYGYSSTNSSSGNFSSSHAIDLGVVAGVDLEFNEKTSFGVDFKYMMNMSSKTNGTTVPGYSSVEKLKYYTANIFARVNF